MKKPMLVVVKAALCSLFTVVNPIFAQNFG